VAELTLASSVTLNYRVDGEGETDLVLINGATLPLEFWGPTAARLAEQARVIRFDQRNAGQTKFEGTFTLNDVAADIAALMYHVGSEQAVVVGHAWGGRAAQVFARDYPHRLTKLVLCGTGGQFPPADTKGVDEEVRRARKAEDRKAWEAAFEQRWMGTGFAARFPDRFQAICDLMWDARPNRDARWDARVSPSPSYWGMTTKPVLLLYGDEDKNGTPENARDLQARLDRAERVTLEQAGHFVVREKEEEVAAAITGFMRD